MSEEKRITVEMEQIEDFEFRVRFGEELADLEMDEPEPLGRGTGPNASRLLAAAVGNCLSASLLFCARKTRTDVRGLRTETTARLGRNEQGRWRFRDIDVRIHAPATADDKPPQMDRCLALFEDYCIVTASVRRGIPVRVEVVGSDGARLFLGGEEGSGTDPDDLAS